MKSTAGTFGTPKPLPGQAGYGATQTDILEKDTQEMEARLQILQDRLKQQQLDSESALSSTGNIGSGKWKSSKAEKGSIRAYGRDISERSKKKVAEHQSGTLLMSRSVNITTTAATSSNANLPPPQQKVLHSGQTASVKSLPPSVLNEPKRPELWDDADVAKWLESLGLPQYIDTFSENEIVRDLILDLTLEDLDYMQITKLAHRKLILRGIEELRQGNMSKEDKLRMTRAPSALLRSQSSSNVITDVKDTTNVGGDQKLVHWSQLQPLAEKEMPLKSQPPVNAADDTINEEAERQAFMQAVAEWRKGGTGADSHQRGKVVAVKPFRSVFEEPSSGGMEEPSNYNQEPDAFVITGAGEWVNPFAAPAELPSTTLLPAGSSLRGGVLDEAAEHAEFVKAVEAWRTGRQTSTTDQDNSTTFGGAAPSTSPRTYISSTEPSLRKLADSLAVQLEKENVVVMQKIQQQKFDAEQRLALAARQLEKLRLAKVTTTSASLNIDDEEEASNQLKSQANTTAASFDDSIDVLDISLPEARTYSVQSSPVKPTSAAYAYEEDANDEPEEPFTQSTVKIALVESIMGNGTGDNEAIEEGFCIVEYDSD